MYKLNTYVVYPMYGICKVIGISDSKVNSNLVECYVLECESENITLKVPINRVKEYRIRKIISKAEADELINVLQTKPQDIENNWKIRYQENEEKLKSGDIKDTIEVARSLFTRNKLKELSASEKRLYEKAYMFIVNEISIALKKDKDEIEDIVSNALEKSAKKFKTKPLEKEKLVKENKDNTKKKKKDTKE
ncbi:CarD family transcriptional regulator [Brachyspira innocens]|uniref:CarD family transcriptional regulator n=1 Tax=Brachyspira innocens TaxID=13264 RepID=A0ABT8Z0L7_9SPIR|nr:CarD family transcriptional regulator [Brachyspira innocens]MDO6992715.1 CarD family transcriptional regulator [Brachyspira innocens]MDO7021684.1 CarD family transcriptional regulator [Brachyspira innocens]